MDAEKRHQLKSNELAEALTKLRGFGSDRQTLIWLAAIVVVVIGWVGYKAWGSMRDSRRASAWQEMIEVSSRMGTDPDGAIAQLRTLVANASDRTLEATSRIRLASLLRQQGERAPEKYAQMLNEADEMLLPVTEQADMPPAFVSEALFALATNYESLREFDKAKAAYERIADARFAGTPFQFPAAERLKTLDELRTPAGFVPGAPPPPPPPQTRPATQPETTATAPSAAAPPAAGGAQPATPPTSQPVTTTPAPAPPGNPSP